MKTVKFHRYAGMDRTPLYTVPGGRIETHLDRRSWLGVIAEKDGWLQIISAQSDGWVKGEHCYASLDFSLSAIPPQMPGQPVLNYALTA